MTDYKNKRGIPSAAEIAATMPNPANAKPSAFPPPGKNIPPIATTAPKSSTQAAADEAFDLDDDEDEDDDDGWGKDDYADLKRFDYNNTDLNKLGDY